MTKELSQALADICAELYSADIKPQITCPDEKFGDYSTNVAYKLADKAKKPPAEIAREIAKKLEKDLKDRVSRVQVAGGGFINIKLHDNVLFGLLNNNAPDKHLDGQTIVCEYSDPNPFKILHAGHLYTSVVGDAIANILEMAGARVHRVNFGGDVGLHVAKSMYAILDTLGGENPEKLAGIVNRADWLAEQYVKGAGAFEKNKQAKEAILDINKRVYALHEKQDKTSPLARIYWECRSWSYDYFNSFYEQIGVQFEKFYPESDMAGLGLKKVRQHADKVYEQSDGAIVFRGEKYGLHTRVFITREGLPTYETKDVGLIFKKQQDYDFDRSIVITDNGQMQYMQVVLKSIEQFEPKLANSTVHLTHGVVKLAGGVKMSSRFGNFAKATDVLNLTKEALIKSKRPDDEKVILGAVKYEFLKTHIAGDIIYDPQESVSLEGNSGPYIQYALVRAKSILAKSNDLQGSQNATLETDERSLARKISMYPEVFAEASKGLAPNHICTYLYELCQLFNRFYEKNRVIDDPRSDVRLALVRAYSETLKNGLKALGIPEMEKM